ncbi:MAG: DUF3592 domain-containing protein [Caldilineaceae bacterium]
MWQSLVGYLFGCGFLAFGLFGLYHLPGRIKLANESWRWPTKVGKIVNSGLVSSGRSYRAEVHYRYKVGCRYYGGSTITWLPKLRRNQTILKTYKKGHAVKVYYNPAHPQISVLEPGYTVFGVLAHCMMFGFFLGAGYIAIASTLAQR